jgi:hypothetical protein
MNKQIPLDPFQSVPTTGIAICDMNKHLSTVLEKITLTLGGGAFTRAMITLVQLKANGKVIWESDGPKIDLVSQYHRAAADVTILKIDFMDRDARTANAFQAGAIDLSRLSNVTNLRLEVTISGATTPTLTGFVDVSPPSDNPAEANLRWLIGRRHRTTVTVGAAGTFALPISHLESSGGGSAFRRLYIFSAQMNAFKLVRDGVIDFELTKLQNESSQKDNGKNPQVNLIVIDPVQDGQLSDRLWDTRPGSSVRSAQLYGTFAAAETFVVEAEELLPLAAY